MVKIKRRSVLTVTMKMGLFLPWAFAGCGGNSTPPDGAQANTTLPKEVTENMDKAYERNRRVQSKK